MIFARIEGADKTEGDQDQSKKGSVAGCSLEIPDRTDCCWANSAGICFMDHDAYPQCCKKSVCDHYCQSDI